MNLTINVDELGFAPTQQVQEEQLDGRTTRAFRGTGTGLVPVPGCLEVTAVRMPGLVITPERVDEVPMDGSDRPQYLAIRRKQYRLIKGLDGTPLLQRASCSADGIWQKPPGDQPNIFVTGRWDEEVSPPIPGGLTVAEPNPPRVGVEVGGPQPDAATRGRGRAGTATAPEAESAKE